MWRLPRRVRVSGVEVPSGGPSYGVISTWPVEVVVHRYRWKGSSLLLTANRSWDSLGKAEGTSEKEEGKTL